MLHLKASVASSVNSDDGDCDNSNACIDKPHDLSEALTAQPKFSTSDHLRNAWNQLRFGWTLRYWPQFSKDVPIVFLGCWYSPVDGSFSQFPKFVSLTRNFSDFADDFSSRLWFSYRANFQPLCSADPILNGSCDSSKPPYASSSRFPTWVDTELGVLVGVSSSDSDLSNAQGELPNNHANLSVKLKHSSNKTNIPIDPLRSHRFPWNERLRALARSVRYEPVGPAIPLSVQTSDCGWGCMIRSGQMLLAQALTVHLLGRNWRLFNHGSLIELPNLSVHRQIIRWFHDSWSLSAPFSLHQLLRASELPPGSWFKPSIICAAILRTMAQAAEHCEELRQLEIYLARDRVVYRDELMNLSRGIYEPRDVNQMHYTDHTGHHRNSLSTGRHSIEATTSEQCNFNHPVILLIPLMLGTKKFIDPIYTPIVTRFLEDPCALGLIGGRPKHSIYVCGYQKRELIVIDPHVTQSVVNVESERFSVKSWHCLIPKLMHMSKLDPSCAVGFYCRTRGELSDLLDRLPSLFSCSPHRPGASSSLIEIISSPVTDCSSLSHH